MPVDEGTEGKAILPAAMEVLNIDIVVGSSFALAPQEQTFFGGGRLYFNVLDSKSQDDGPNETKSHLYVAVDNFLGTNANQLDVFAGNKVERLVDVCDLVESHLAPIRLGQSFARDDLKQEHELEAMSEVFLDVLDLRISFSKVRVAPGGKCFALLFLPGGIKQAAPLPLLLLFHVVSVDMVAVERIVVVAVQVEPVGLLVVVLLSVQGGHYVTSLFSLGRLCLISFGAQAGLRETIGELR